ncbi:hypothetical protein QBC34DRAFT_301814 [Podospora aff. communis PSN243]|uniref:C2H2-type domain-containing protein n=1 Tax=Podospora aff. communis PSN243 TaxID=3040156 RepID=A0AAV9GGV7_9PEZI|nr:hypothetical protein QBC34DRAFT_301814 [Podospora aff. communis PSN243]
MDHVHRKRQVTLRRRKEEEYLAEEARIRQREQEVITFTGVPAAVQAQETPSLREQQAEWISDDDEWAASETPATSSHSPSVQAQDPQGSRPAQIIYARPSEHIETTPSGRPYKMWKDDFGSLRKACGALIPDKYEFSDAIPGRPWVCPIRPCRKVFPGVTALGAHFSAEHRAALLHDNVDGTLSLKGYYHVEKSDGPSSVMIVSRGAPSADEPPPVPPSLPAAAARILGLKAANEEQEGSPVAPALIPPPMPPLRMRSDDATLLAMALAAPSVAQTAIEPDQDWKAFWDYAQAFLTVHNGPTLPDKGYVRQLITLPRVRDLKWNEVRQAQYPFQDSKPRDVSALLIQLTGEPAPEPCVRCQVGKGPFDGCIMIAREAHTDPLRTIISCANCFYHYNQTYCSHKYWASERAQSLLVERYKADPMLRQAFEIAEDADMDNTQDVITPQDEDALPPGGSSTQTPIEQSSTEHTPIETAENGRRYDMWPGKFFDNTGALMSTSGALLPAGYQLDSRNSQNPWICPIRTCRRPCAKLGDLGLHFQRAHFACLLNDNGDGTLSEVGVFPSGTFSTTANAIIISRNGTKLSSQPAQTRVKIRTRHRRSVAESDGELDPDTFSVAQTHGKGDAMALWTYMKQHIPRQIMPQKRGVLELLNMPQLRNLKVNPRKAHRGFVEKKVRDIAALAIQLTGQRPPEACKRCAENKGLWKGCVVINPNAPYNLRSRYTGCANCVYHGNQTYCTIREDVLQALEAQAHEPEAPSSDGDFDTPLRASGRMLPAPLASAQQAQPPAQAPAPVPAAATPNTTQAAAAPAVNTIYMRPQMGLPRQPQSAAAPPPNPPNQGSSLVHTGVIQSADILEMEPWEVAPGRITETATAESENIAFSKSYLSTNHVVPVMDDVFFRVDTIYSGATLQIDPEEFKTRICSVASGKVRVRTGDEPEFTIGPHGMFKVKPGVGCKVQNWMYMDAILHVTVLDGFI